MHHDPILTIVYNDFRSVDKKSYRCLRVPLIILFLFVAKDELHNKLVQEMLDKKINFPNSMFGTTIEKHVSSITNALWYIDGNKDKLESRCRTTDASYPAQ